MTALRNLLNLCAPYEGVRDLLDGVRTLSGAGEPSAANSPALYGPRTPQQPPACEYLPARSRRQAKTRCRRAAAGADWSGVGRRHAGEDSPQALSSPGSERRSRSRPFRGQTPNKQEWLNGSALQSITCDAYGRWVMTQQPPNTSAGRFGVRGGRWVSVGSLPNSQNRRKLLEYWCLRQRSFKVLGVGYLPAVRRQEGMPAEKPEVAVPGRHAPGQRVPDRAVTSRHLGSRRVQGGTAFRLHSAPGAGKCWGLERRQDGSTGLGGVPAADQGQPEPRAQPRQAHMLAFTGRLPVRRPRLAGHGTACGVGFKRGFPGPISGRSRASVSAKTY
jgi:hypothetical protein